MQLFCHNTINCSKAVSHFTLALNFDLNSSIGFRKGKCLWILIDFGQQKPYMYIATFFRMRWQPDISYSLSVSITPVMNYRRCLLRMPTLLMFNLCYINHFIAISLSLVDFRLLVLHTNFSIPVNFSQPNGLLFYCTPRWFEAECLFQKSQINVYSGQIQEN